MIRPEVDVVVIGAGAAGLFCAAEAAKRNRSVVILEHARKPAEKVRISGGGRCNFTNVHASPDQYLSRNPRFCASALSQYTARDFVALVEQYRIAYHEKKLGQLFCDGPSTQIVDLLLAECRRPEVTLHLQTSAREISKPDRRFRVTTGDAEIACESLVVASGGLSVPKMGATGFGYDLARQFGLRIVHPSPALVPLTFHQVELRKWEGLAGVSTDAEVRCGSQKFREALLYTHRGLSGPAVLQISSYWEPGLPLQIDLSPTQDTRQLLLSTKRMRTRQEFGSVLAGLLPKRLAQRVVEQSAIGATRLAEVPDAQLLNLAKAIHTWTPQIDGTEGYRIAEVTLGGVDTRDLSSKTMEARNVAGLFFIGEVVDVTGHLGGYNFQWAWSSAVAAGRVC